MAKKALKVRVRLTRVHVWHGLERAGQPDEGHLVDDTPELRQAAARRLLVIVDDPQAPSEPETKADGPDA